MPADGSPAFLDYERFDPDAPEKTAANGFDS
jgi:hypothetical protein